MFLCVPPLLSFDEDKSVRTDFLLLLLRKVVFNSVEFRSLGALCGRFRELLAVLFRLVELELICLNCFDVKADTAAAERLSDRGPLLPFLLDIGNFCFPLKPTSLSVNCRAVTVREHELGALLPEPGKRLERRERSDIMVFVALDSFPRVTRHRDCGCECHHRLHWSRLPIRGFIRITSDDFHYYFF